MLAPPQPLIPMLSPTLDLIFNDERKSHARTLIDIPVFVRSFSIITGFTIIDGDDITKDVVLGMRFCKKNHTAYPRVKDTAY
ncbi:hypothetical protein Tco_0169476 [Tanacetum coccineum]